MTRATFGTMPDGTGIDVYTMSNAGGIEVRVITYGGIIVSLRTPDQEGRLDDIVLGFDRLEDYLDSSPYFGAITGRYANRIARGRFTLDGATYELATNDGEHHLHGGRQGFDKVVWDATSFADDRGAGVRLRHTSPDGHEGYPGTLVVTVTYTLTERDELIVDYQATTDEATPVNLTQHSYFNLAGHGRGTVLDHVLWIDADRYTPVDAGLIPTGELAPVDGTPFDFRQARAIGARIDAGDTRAIGARIDAGVEQLRHAGGYDHNFVLNRHGDDVAPVARVTEPTTGRRLAISTTEPGLQFYSGNFLDGSLTGKSGRTYPHRGGFCVETQHFPDSPNHPDFPSTILRPGDVYRSRTVFGFGIHTTTAGG